MNESSYIRSITRHLPINRYRWKIHDDFAGGIPDWFYEGEKSDLWIEFKYIKKLPVREDTKIDLTKKKYLSELQQQWLERKSKVRGDCWVVVGSDVGGVVFEDLEWMKPITKLEFVSRALPAKKLAKLIEQKTN